METFNSIRPGTYSVSLVCDPSEPQQFSNSSSLLGILVDFSIGQLNVTGQVRAIEETFVSAGGTGVINLRLVEVAINDTSIPVSQAAALSKDDLLLAHAGEIISRKNGRELRGHEAYTVENIFQFNEKIGARDITETTRIEAVGLPKSNATKLLSPTWDTILISLGSSEQETVDLEEELRTLATMNITTIPLTDPLNSFTSRSSLIQRFESQGINDPEQDQRVKEIKDLLIPLYDDAEEIFRSYPKRVTEGDRSFEGPEQINVQISNNGITTSYVYNKIPSQLDRSIRELEDTWGARQREEEIRNGRRDEITEEFFSNVNTFAPRDWPSPSEIEFDDDNKLSRDKLMEEMIQALGGLELERMQYDLAKPTGGLGVIVGPAGGGPFYEIRRLNNVDLDPQTFSRFGPGMFVSEWPRVRNLAEPVDSPGFLAPGTRVTVNIFQERENSGGIPFIEQSPQTFAPPLAT